MFLKLSRKLQPIQRGGNVDFLFRLARPTFFTYTEEKLSAREVIEEGLFGQGKYSSRFKKKFTLRWISIVA